MIDNLTLFLKDHKINIEPLDVKSVIASGNRWMKYLKMKERLKYHQCGNIIGVKEHLSNFFIGGFALTYCDAIITRDRGIYKKYFPDLRII